MAEYIEREALLNELEEELKFNTPMYNKEQNEFVNRGIKIAIRDIRKQPTADVQEVRHGEWIKSKNERKCSICGYFYFTNTKSFNYCPNCGATMNKDKKRTGMTNFEKIKQMSIEEMAECILDEFRVECNEECAYNNDFVECRYCIKNWLESEAEE